MSRVSCIALLTFLLMGCPLLRAQEPAEHPADRKTDIPKPKPKPTPRSGIGDNNSLVPPANRRPNGEGNPLQPGSHTNGLKDPHKGFTHTTKTNYPGVDGFPIDPKSESKPGVTHPGAETTKEGSKDAEKKHEPHVEGVGCAALKDAAARQKCEEEEKLKAFELRYPKNQ